MSDGSFFERLIELRAAFAAAGDDDRTVAISIEDAIAEAEAAFATLRAADEAALLGGDTGRVGGGPA